MQTRIFSEKTLRGSKSEQKQKHPPFLEDLHAFRGDRKVSRVMRRWKELKIATRQLAFQSGTAARIRLKSCDWILPHM